MDLREIPRLYAILDAGAVQAVGLNLVDAAASLRDAGVSLLQYRDKKAGEEEIFKNAEAIKRIFHGCSTTLILNDWPEIARAAGWDGVHVGQTDVAVSSARRILGSERMVGVSTHSLEQFRSALSTDANYIAYGPIFNTATKQDAEAPVGLQQLEQVRSLSSRPLVAIGGISQGRIERTFAAGADCVAVIGALFQQGQPLRDTAHQLMRTAERFA